MTGATALAVLCLALLIVSMDVSVLFFAVPHIAEELAPSATQMLWIFDIYGFVLAGLLLTMGNVAALPRNEINDRAPDHAQPPTRVAP